MVGSSLNKAFLYSESELFDLNSLIDSSLGWTLENAEAINDNGQIVGYGMFEGERHAYLLNPITFTSSGENITVGNITTFGDSVLLQGGKISLTGENLATSGGSITIDGETIIDSSNSELTFDSSSREDATAGGDITFKNTLDGVSVGTQNLKFKAGADNILFEGAVGSNAAFLDFTVEGAGTFTAQEDITILGNLGLEVINDIKTANLSADGLATISLGKVGEEVFDSTGNVTTGDINALGLSVLNNGSFTAGDLETSDGDIDIISLDNLTVGNLTATNGASSLISGTGGITVNGTATSHQMSIALAKQTITTNDLTSNQGAVILKSSKRAVRVNGAVTAKEDVSLAAVKNLVVGEVTSADGGVALISATGKIRNTGAVTAVEDVIVGAAQDIVTKGITASLGTVGVVSTEGAVKVNGVINSAFDVEIAAKQNVTTKKIETYEGAVAIEAEQGEAFIRGNIRTVGENVYVRAAQTVNVRNVISKGGDVSLISEQGFLKTGFLRSNRSKKAGSFI